MQNPLRRQRPLGILTSTPGIGDGLPMGPQEANPVLTEAPVEQPPQRGMPQIPPSARSTDPWSKANVRRTLLDLGGAFLSSKDFAGGMGAASQALGGRMDQLQAEATPKRQYGVGPDGTFEARTDPVTGETTFHRIEQFEDVLAEQRQIARMEKEPILTPEDHIDVRSRAMSAILDLPEHERAGAYLYLMQNPHAFGNIDTTGMPETYDHRYATSIAGMGLTAHQARQMQLREEDLERKREADRVRERQGGERNSIARTRANNAPSARPQSHPKPPSGFLLD